MFIDALERASRSEESRESSSLVQWLPIGPEWRVPRNPVADGRDRA
jgi:hypothetical protein